MPCSWQGHIYIQAKGSFSESDVFDIITVNLAENGNAMTVAWAICLPGTVPSTRISGTVCTIASVVMARFSKDRRWGSGKGYSLLGPRNPDPGTDVPESSEQAWWSSTCTAHNEPRLTQFPRRLFSV